MIAEVSALSEANVILVEDPRQLELSSYGIQGPRGNAILSGNGAPSPAPNNGIENDLYLNLDNGYLYKKLSGVWTYQAYITPQQKKFTISPVDIAAGHVTLIPTPNDPDTVTLEFLSGGGQENGVDFEVIGDILSWDGLGLDGFIESGDIIIVRY
jgi:hypothetical protein